jgi:hypothetical protein
MSKVQLDFNEWNGVKDVLLFHSGGQLGFDTVYNALRWGHGDKRMESATGALEAINQIAGNIAGALEYLRWWGLTSSQVEGRVYAAKAANLALPHQQNILNAQPSVISYRGQQLDRVKEQLARTNQVLVRERY